MLLKTCSKPGREEIEEELEWRLKNPEVALRERFRETLEDFGFVEEEEEMENEYMERAPPVSLGINRNNSDIDSEIDHEEIRR